MAIVGIFVVACLVFGVTILSGWAAGGHSETYSSVLADSSSGALSLDSLPASGLGASGTSLARSAQLSELVDGQVTLMCACGSLQHVLCTSAHTACRVQARQPARLASRQQLLQGHELLWLAGGFARRCSCCQGSSSRQ